MKLATLSGAILAGSLSLASSVLADDYLVSERRSLYKRQNDVTRNITFLHVNDVHAHLDEYRSSGALVVCRVFGLVHEQPRIAQDIH